jgi:hypothetical protein
MPSLDNFRANDLRKQFLLFMNKAPSNCNNTLGLQEDNKKKIITSHYNVIVYLKL